MAEQEQEQNEQICRHYRALYGACSEHILLQRRPGYLSVSGYHRMNTLRVDGKIYLVIYLFIYRFVQCTGERTIGHVVPYLVRPPNPTP